MHYNHSQREYMTPIHTPQLRLHSVLLDTPTWLPCHLKRFPPRLYPTKEAVPRFYGRGLLSVLSAYLLFFTHSPYSSALSSPFFLYPIRSLLHRYLLPAFFHPFILRLLRTFYFILVLALSLYPTSLRFPVAACCTHAAFYVFMRSLPRRP